MTKTNSIITIIHAIGLPIPVLAKWLQRPEARVRSWVYRGIKIPPKDEIKIRSLHREMIKIFSATDGTNPKLFSTKKTQPTIENTFQTLFLFKHTHAGTTYTLPIMANNESDAHDEYLRVIKTAQYVDRKPKASNTITKECESCGKPMQLRQSIIDKGRGRYCSPACSGHAKKSAHAPITIEIKEPKDAFKIPEPKTIKKITAKCAHCGKTFYTKPSVIAKGWGKTCSNKCSAKHTAKERVDRMNAARLRKIEGAQE